MYHNNIQESLQLCMCTIKALSDHLTSIYSAIYDSRLSLNGQHRHVFNNSLSSDSNYHRYHNYCEGYIDLDNKSIKTPCSSENCDYCLNIVNSDNNFKSTLNTKCINDDTLIPVIDGNKKDINRVKPPNDSGSENNKDVLSLKSNKVKSPFLQYGKLNKNKRNKNLNKDGKKSKKHTKSSKVLIKELDKLLDEFIDNPKLILKSLSKRLNESNISLNDTNESTDKIAPTDTNNVKYQHQVTDNIRVRITARSNDDEKSQSIPNIVISEDKSQGKSKSPTYSFKLMHPSDSVDVKVDISPSPDSTLNKSDKDNDGNVSNSTTVSQHVNVSDTESNSSFDDIISSFQSLLGNRLKIFKNNCNDSENISNINSPSISSPFNLKSKSYSACSNCDFVYSKSKISKSSPPMEISSNHLEYYISSHESNDPLKLERINKRNVSVILSDLSVSNLSDIHSKYSFRNPVIQPVVIPIDENYQMKL